MKANGDLHSVNPVKFSQIFELCTIMLFVELFARASFLVQISRKLVHSIILQWQSSELVLVLVEENRKDEMLELLGRSRFVTNWYNVMDAFIQGWYDCIRLL